MIELRIRSGSPADATAVLALFDEAIEWLIGKGLSGQWGEAPFSTRPDMCDRVDRMLAGDGVRVAEHGETIVGALAFGTAHEYAPPSPVAEIYVTMLISARRLSGNAIGARLLTRAHELALERGVRRVRVDCWADAPALVTFYEQQGFRRDGRFDLRGWRGQILSRPV